MNTEKLVQIRDTIDTKIGEVTARLQKMDHSTQLVEVWRGAQALQALLEVKRNLNLLGFSMVEGEEE